MNRSITSSLLLLVAAAGCAPAYRNEPLAEYAPQAGYRFETLRPGEGNSDELFVCVTFSGGGTRAAALAYGVLQELRETQIAVGGRPRRMLDEVDVISSVSGGSFTAAGYALWRDGLFDGRFEQLFLKRNVQAALIWRVFSFPNVLLLPLVILDRVDVVADYFHEQIFERATYADLLRDGRRPFIVINATNLAAGQRFEFTQDDFDVLGSDLSSMPIGYAVGASQAVPVLFSPMRFKYYPGQASCAAIAEVLSRAAERPRTHMPRREEWVRHLLPTTRPGEEPPTCIEPEAHRWLYLVDGGSADNLGLSYVIENLEAGCIQKKLLEKRNGGVRRLVVIIVNAGAKRPSRIESRDASPGLLSMGYRAAMIAVDHYSHALTTMVRNLLLERAERVRKLYESYVRALADCDPDATPPERPEELRFNAYVVEVNLEHVPDEAVRRELMGLPTNYNLTADQVDRVVSAGRVLLRLDPDFRRLLQDLSGQAADSPESLPGTTVTEKARNRRQ